MNAAAEHAIWLAKTHSFCLFPCEPGSKKPVKDQSWKEISTNDPAKIQKIAEYPAYADCNWALDCEKSGLIVLDEDNKGEKNGCNTMLQYPDPETGLVAATPNEGFHYYYKGQARSSIETALGDGLDVKSQGGYVLIPGSRLDGVEKPYSWVRKEAPTPAPQWLLDKLAAPREKDPQRDEPVVEEQIHHVRAAVRYLETEAPEAIQGDGGDKTTFAVACKVRDLGVEQNTAFELMAEHWNEQKAQPPWTMPELLTKVRNAYKYAENRQGSATPEAIFRDPPTPAEPETPTTPAKPTRTLRAFGMRSAADITMADIKPRAWVLGRRYLAGDITVTVAPGGVGKSILTILEALSIATGRQLGHDKVHRKGGALLFNAEDNFDEMDRRAMAAKRHHGLTEKECEKFLFRSMRGEETRLVSPGRNGEAVVNHKLVQELKDTIRHYDAKLLSLDPFVRWHGYGENDNSDIDKVMAVLAGIAEETQCAVGIIHHTNKIKDGEGRGDANRSRGASSLVNAARIAHTLFGMSSVEARHYGTEVDRRHWYMRLDDAKSNFAMMSGEPKWFEKISVNLTLAGDPTGTLEAVPLEFNVPDDDAPAIREAVSQYVTTNKPISLYSLSTKLAAQGFLNGQARTIQRRVLGAFQTPYQIGGLVYRIREIEKQGKGMIDHLVCEVDLVKGDN